MNTDDPLMLRAIAKTITLAANNIHQKATDTSLIISQLETLGRAGTQGDSYNTPKYSIEIQLLQHLSSTGKGAVKSIVLSPGHPIYEEIRQFMIAECHRAIENNDKIIRTEVGKLGIEVKEDEPPAAS